MVLTTLIEFDGQTGWVLLLAPLAVLGVVAIGVIAGRERTVRPPEPDLLPVPITKSRALPEPMPTGSPPPTAVVELEPYDTEPEKPALRGSPDSVGNLIESVARSTQQAPVRAQQTTSQTASVPESADISPADISADAPIASRKAALLEAEQRFDDAAVARLSLQLARDLMAKDETGEEVKLHLRRAIILSSRLKDDDTHAAGRLELGDIMAKEGDLTTACEHWQIARQIFWDHDAKAKQADVDQRMIANHCPTDWVLNDF